MAGRLQLRRGTTSQNDAFTGAIGEMTMDTQKKNIRLHDGSTLGGCGTIDPVVAFWRSGVNWYRKYASGWVEQGGGHTVSAFDTEETQNLHIAMADTNYSVMVSSTVGSKVVMGWVTSTSSIKIQASSISGSSLPMVIWEVKGMAA